MRPGDQERELDAAIGRMLREEADRPRVERTRPDEGWAAYAWAEDALVRWTAPRRREPRVVVHLPSGMRRFAPRTLTPPRDGSALRLVTHADWRVHIRRLQLLPTRPAGIPARPPWTGTLGQLARGEAPRRGTA